MLTVVERTTSSCGSTDEPNVDPSASVFSTRTTATRGVVEERRSDPVPAGAPTKSLTSSVLTLPSAGSTAVRVYVRPVPVSVYAKVTLPVAPVVPVTDAEVDQ